MKYEKVITDEKRKEILQAYFGSNLSVSYITRKFKVNETVLNSIVCEHTRKTLAERTINKISSPVQNGRSDWVTNIFENIIKRKLNHN